ncbi:protein-glutamate O-methyltransferase CheR [Roseomonas sp. 18066]|uniref:CheR family methyltransferase n=1 Tax=Roseomonas sp. 18066 TaxID=2681412 RepID=UPI001F2EFB1B|nr:protein-glutamate O-methyltransferase CheR [Roseomonas sp. 18066]
MTPQPGSLPAFTPHFLPDVDFTRLKRLVIARTGHFYYQDKDALLWERLRRRLRETGLTSAGAYLSRLLDEAQGPAEWAALEAEITVGETFFFRYAEQFAALADTILPDILARHGEEKRIRAWSAGCAIGAEPYSLAILLHRLLGDALEHWRPALIGSDLNAAALAQARRGEYSRWALRTLPAEELERDFTAVENGRRFQLRPQFRAMVQFERHNLLSLLDGSSPLQFSEFDLILCRNVLIYFHPEVVEQVVRALAERLREGGWLLLGHAEPNPAFAEFLDVVQLPGTVAYRRGGAPRPAPVAAALPVPVIAPPLPLPLGPPVVAARPAPPPPVAAPPPDAADWQAELAAARGRADAGDLDGALQACRAGLLLQPTEAALHYYDGLIRRGLRQPREAAQAFRRALYLQGDFAMAHYQLGLLLLDEGERAAGRRALTVAARIAQGQPPGAPLAEGDGMTAAGLRDLARLQLDAVDRMGRA